MVSPINALIREKANWKEKGKETKAFWGYKPGKSKMLELQKSTGHWTYKIVNLCVRLSKIML